MNYLYIAEIENNKALITKKWGVANIERTQSLGEIKWYNALRRYVFYPYSNMLFDAKCLTEITNFINNEMELRKL